MVVIHSKGHAFDVNESDDIKQDLGTNNATSNHNEIEIAKNRYALSPKFVDLASNYIKWPINQDKDEYNLDTGPFVIDSYCNICNQSLPIGTTRIRCADCDDYDMCLPCTCTLTATEPHELSHKYIPICPNLFKLFSDGWSADEEFLLLEGISKYGFGNWKEVAEMVNRVSEKQKTSAECESHYSEVYISSSTCPFPDISKLRTPVTDEKNKIELNQFFDNLLKKHKTSENPDSDDRIISSEVSGSHSSYIPPPVNILKSNPSKLKLFQNFTGYNVYRDELENEYNNDAELILKDLEFSPTDSPIEIEFKVQLIELYNSFLDERIYRKRVLMHKFWNDYQVRETDLQNMTDAEKLVYWRLTPLSRFQLEDEHIDLTHLLVAKGELERRMETVQQWRSLGLETLEDVQSYESNRPNSKQAHSARYKHLTNKLNGDTRKILNGASLTKEHVVSHMEDIKTKFCDDLCISRAQLDSMFDDVLELGIKNSEPITVDDTATLPLWDICLYNSKITLNDKDFPAIRNLPSLAGLEDDCELRVILNTNEDEFDLARLSLSNLEFEKDHKNTGLEQSNVISNHEAHIYVTKFNNDGTKVQKISKRRKRV